MKNNENKLPTSPDWSTAPDWAMWWAIDADGSTYWYEERPDIGDSVWFPIGGTYDRHVKLSAENWEDSLQKRPENA